MLSTGMRGSWSLRPGRSSQAGGQPRHRPGLSREHDTFIGNFACVKTLTSYRVQKREGASVRENLWKLDLATTCGSHRDHCLSAERALGCSEIATVGCVLAESRPLAD